MSPHDGHVYSEPAISPDGGFVAYVSDRSGKDELWLQQVGGEDPIQPTHSNESVEFPAFFPDGKRIVYVTTSAESRKSSISHLRSATDHLLLSPRLNSERQSSKLAHP